MAAFSTAMALVMIASGIAGLEWSPTTLQNNAVVYACATGTLSLPWNLTIVPGDIIADINWFVLGMSEEMIAGVVHNNFFAMPAFANRARRVTNAGIELDHVGVSETGNYSVEVIGRTAAGVMTTLKRAVTVHISDGLQTTDGRLHITQQPEAEYDVATDRYHVVLNCGIFIYPTHPAFEVTWETPSGHRMNSSGYTNGAFHLRLDNPVQEGVYTCRLPAVPSCGHGNGTAVAVTWMVHRTEARLLLVEARQAALDATNKDLEAKNRQQDSTNKDLEAKIRQQDATNKEQDATNKDLEAKNSEQDTKTKALELANSNLVRQNTALLNRTSTLENRVRVLENQVLKVQQGELQNSTSALQGLQTQTVSFHARLAGDGTVAPSTTLVLPHVDRNHGDGYDRTTGIFTAPYSGTYCFLVTAAYTDSDAGAGGAVLFLLVNNGAVAGIMQPSASGQQSASLHAVVALQAGDTAYLWNYDYSTHYLYLATSFSGFLVDHTPN